MKTFTSRAFALFTIISMLIVMLMATALPAMAIDIGKDAVFKTVQVRVPVMAAVNTNTGTDTLVNIILFILGTPMIQGTIIFLILSGLGLAFAKYAWARHVINLGIIAYEYAEKQGLIQGLKGYKKFDPFMEQFIKSYQDKYGTVPSPEAKGIAVKAMETKVQEAHSGGK